MDTPGKISEFQPTPPARTETLSDLFSATPLLISTHSAREDGDNAGYSLFGKPIISTHSAREDGDGYLKKKESWLIYFNPLRPRGRRRCCVRPPVLRIYFNPLRPRGRRPVQSCIELFEREFQPTPPARTETEIDFLLVLLYDISTHSAREDGDRIQYGSALASQYFNPLRPRGRRPKSPITYIMHRIFQPTPPARTETNDATLIHFWIQISTHSAREDGDVGVGVFFNGKFKFQPTPPARTETPPP